MTTRTTKRDAKVNGLASLDAMVAMLEQNLKGSQGSERLRLQAELDGVRARIDEVKAA